MVGREEEAGADERVRHNNNNNDNRNWLSHSYKKESERKEVTTKAAHNCNQTVSVTKGNRNIDIDR